MGDARRCATLDDWHGCSSSLHDAWTHALHGFESPASALAVQRWACVADGRFAPLGQPNAPNDAHGMSRARALSMSESECLAFPWHALNASWHPHEGHPAVFGLGRDVNALLRTNNLALALSMPMVPFRRGSAHVPMWTPCTNLAFTLCAARGRLGNGRMSRLQRPGGSALYLATRGVDIMATCDASVPVPRVQKVHNFSCAAGKEQQRSCMRAHDATWDECASRPPQ